MSIDSDFWPRRAFLGALCCLAFVTFAISGCNSESTASLTQRNDHGQSVEDVNEVEQLHQPMSRIDATQSSTDASHPKTFQEAVSEVVRLNEAILEESALVNDTAADDKVHAISHLLKEMNELASKEKMTDRQRSFVQMAVTKLFENFKAVDAAIHGEQGMSYEAAAMDIEDNLYILQNVCANMKN